MKKTINPEKLPRDYKYAAVFQHMLKNPREYFEFIQQIYLAAILGLMQDSLLQDIQDHGRCLVSQSLMQKMKNASKAMDSLVDTLMKETIAMKDMNMSDYERQTSDANNLLPVCNDILQYIFWEGMNGWRSKEFKKRMSDIVPEAYKEEIFKQFEASLREEHKDIYERMEKEEESVAPEKKAIYDAIERVLTTPKKKTA